MRRWDKSRPKRRQAAALQGVSVYRGSSRGLGGVGGSCSPLFSPVCERTSLIAPTLESIAEVSIGMKITFELLVRVMSRRLSIYRVVIKYCPGSPPGIA